MNKVLVIGGVGYIGLYVCKVFVVVGYVFVIYDNFVIGWEDVVKFGFFEKGDLLDWFCLDEVFVEYKFVVVMYFVVFSQVGESMKDFGIYWWNNVVGLFNLIEVVVIVSCFDFVFLLICVIYGEQDGVMLDENCVQELINVYGVFKCVIEDMLINFGQSYGFRFVIFCYFNVVGGDFEGEIGEFYQFEMYLILLMLDVVDGCCVVLIIFGIDYDILDGICICDYVYVCDLVDVYVLGVKWLVDGKGSCVFNFGIGNGFLVCEVVKYFGDIMNKLVLVVEGECCVGDVIKLVLGSKCVEVEFGWKLQCLNMKDMIVDVWWWYQNGGYEKQCIGVVFCLI